MAMKKLTKLQQALVSKGFSTPNHWGEQDRPLRGGRQQAVVWGRTVRVRTYSDHYRAWLGDASVVELDSL